MTADPDVIALLSGFAPTVGMPVSLVVSIAAGESGLDPDAVGDNGTSFGLIQIHDAVHGDHGGAYWTGLDGAARSLTEMAPRWQQAARQYSQSIARWEDATAIAKAAMLGAIWVAAQGCRPPSMGRCQDAVNLALAALGQGGVVVPQPSMQQVPGSPANCYPDRQGFEPEAIVLHIMEGTLAGCDAWFANPAARAGAHYGIGKDGEIHQYYRLDQAPWANGIIEDGYTAKLIDANARANPNHWTISIEHEGHSGDVMTAAQFVASTGLAAWLWQSIILPNGATGKALDRDHILYHRDISPKTRSGCPGWDEAFRQTYINAVAALLQPAPPVPPPPPPVPGPTIDQVKVGIAIKVLNGEWQAAADDLAKILGGKG